MSWIEDSPGYWWFGMGTIASKFNFSSVKKELLVSLKTLVKAFQSNIPWKATHSSNFHIALLDLISLSKFLLVCYYILLNTPCDQCWACDSISQVIGKNYVALTLVPLLARTFSCSKKKMWNQEYQTTSESGFHYVLVCS